MACRDFSAVTSGNNWPRLCYHTCFGLADGFARLLLQILPINLSSVLSSRKSSQSNVRFGQREWPPPGIAKVRLWPVVRIQHHAIKRPHEPK